MEILVKQFAKDHGHTETTIKYYIKMKLLPEPIKRGGYGVGVNLFFKDEALVTRLLNRILELKRFGYKLSEIKAVLEKEQSQTNIIPSKMYLQRGGKFYYVLDEDEINESYKFYTSLSDLITPEFVKENHLSKFGTPDELRKYAQEIEQRRLFVPNHIYDDRLIHSRHDDDTLTFLMHLHSQEKLTWEQLENLYKRQRINIEKYFHFPNDKTGWIEYKKQDIMNSFCFILADYFDLIKNLIKPNYWDHRYPSIEEFYQDFIDGKCAFLPAAFGGDIDVFLKKIK